MGHNGAPVVGVCSIVSSGSGDPLHFLCGTAALMARSYYPSSQSLACISDVSLIVDKKLLE